MPDDGELMARVRQGEQSALELLFARWEAPLFAFFYRLGCPPAAVEDLAEDVLVALYRQRYRYDPGRPLAPWLFGIARLVWKDYVRRRGRELARTTSLEDAADVPAREAGPEASAEIHEQAGRIRRAVERLPEELKETFLLRHYHNLGYEEVAEALGVPLGTVKWRIHEAVRWISDMLAPAPRERA